MTDRLGELSDAGVAVWLDDISRERLVTNNLATLRTDKHVVGVTSNPTIFANALSKGNFYDDIIADFRVRKLSPNMAAQAVTTIDIREACDVMRPVYDATGGIDGRVSIEVDPRVARDTAATVAQARALWWAVDRPNLFIKIPATVAGLPAITSTLADGISVNVTLIFSLERYEQVMQAFLAGLEQAQQNGHQLSRLTSVASFFVSRVDTEIDNRLEKIGTTEAIQLQGKAAVANARLAYQRYEQIFSSDRWKRLAELGAHPQRPLWASTGVKNPKYPDTLYVTELVAPGTVNTMPEATLNAFAEHGELRGNTITSNYADAHDVFQALARVGIDYTDVVKVLEDEGVTKFEKSWQELLDSLEKQLTAS